MHRLAKLFQTHSRLTGHAFSRRCYAKEVKFGATAREEMIAGEFRGFWVCVACCRAAI